MKSLSSRIVIVASAALLLLGGCGKETKTGDSTSLNSAPGDATKPNLATKPAAKIAASHTAPRQGGQVVESGKYYLELVPEQAASVTHLDFYLLEGDKHEIIPTAKVTAEIQLPDGQLKTVPFNYDASGKHYAAMVNDRVVGQYQVKITATVGSEQVDGRFKFDR